jgi:hypothetical protein
METPNTTLHYHEIIIFGTYMKRASLITVYLFGTGYSSPTSYKPV